MTLKETVHVSKHPIVAHKLSQLREKGQKPKAVRELTRDLSILLGYEASNDLELVQGERVKLYRVGWVIYRGQLCALYESNE